MLEQSLAVFGLSRKPHVASKVLGHRKPMGLKLMELFAERLAAEMSARKLSANALAKMSGVGQRSISRILLKQQDPSLTMVEDIAKALGLPAVVMLTAVGAGNVRFLTSPYPRVFDAPHDQENSDRKKGKRGLR